MLTFGIRFTFVWPQIVFFVFECAPFHCRVKRKLTVSLRGIYVFGMFRISYIVTRSHICNTSVENKCKNLLTRLFICVGAFAICIRSIHFSTISFRFTAFLIRNV